MPLVVALLVVNRMEQFHVHGCGCCELVLVAKVDQIREFILCYISNLSRSNHSPSYQRGPKRNAFQQQFAEHCKSPQYSCVSVPNLNIVNRLAPVLVHAID